jgi:uncharacterized protein (DUF3084 family)
MTGARRVVAMATLLAVVAGCAASSPARGVVLLDRADRLAREGTWDEAVRAYGEYLRHHPEGEGAPRAAASRDALRALLTTRAEAARLREDLTRLREELARRDSDLVRVRQESERLKAGLEKLKQVDLKLERRR